MRDVQIGNLTVGNDRPLTLIAGPCQLESADHAQMIAGILKEACEKAGAQYIFKGSFDKANRTSLNAAPPLGLDKGLEVLASVKSTLGVPVLCALLKFLQLGRKKKTDVKKVEQDKKKSD